MAQTGVAQIGGESPSRRFFNAAGLEYTPLYREIGNLKVLVFVDPSTVLEVAQAVQFVMGLFSGSPNDNLGSWMQTVSNQLATINSKLDAVLSLLQNINVIIDQRLAVQLEQRILGGIAQYQVKLSTWQGQLQDDDSPGLQALYNFESSFQSDLFAYTQSSYANCLTVAYATRVEIDLLTLLAGQDSSVQLPPFIKSMITYFNVCLDDSQAGTVAGALKDANSSASQNSATEDRLKVASGTFQTNAGCPCGASTRGSTFAYQFQFDAGQDQYIPVVTFVGNWGVCGPCHLGGGSHGLVLKPIRPENYDGQLDPTTAAMLNQLNAAHEAQKEAVANASILEQIVQTLQKLTSNLEAMVAPAAAGAND
jgi:hypothetical protein